MDNKNKSQVFSLHDIIGDRFGKYSKYIIQERALPDVRDGLKPVQRRILYAMYFDNNLYNKPYRKSAKTVGNVIGNYHPHGDSSVYEAMVRLGQHWKVNKLLVDMHGNKGSVDNDPPAAMRYTEARLSEIASLLLEDIEKETVVMAPNFDDTTVEPTTLPAYFPLLLVNGAKGIASGYATEIPPHNLKEVIEGVIHRIKFPDSLLNTVMQHIRGPDFPTGGILQGKEGIIDAYRNGKGKVVIRAKTKIVEQKKINQIIIDEIPFDVVKSDLVKSMDQIKFDKKVDGIDEVRDESDKKGLRIAIDIKKDIDPQIVLNYLYKHTNLQVNYNFNMVAIADKRPKQMGLLQIIDKYIEHQFDVYTKKTKFDLKKAKARLHIIKGLIICVDNLDEVISIIRKSKDKKECKLKLIERFSFSEKQVEAIVSLQLYRLSSTDVSKLVEEKKELEEKCNYFEQLLKDDQKMNNLIIEKLRKVKKTHSEERKTKIEDQIEDISIDKMAMISEEDVMISISRKGYCKRASLKSFNASEPGLPSTKEGDILIAMKEASTKDILLVFTSEGNYLYLPVFELAEARWKDEGVHINNVITLSSGEYLISAILIKEFNPKVNIVMTTRNGQIKKTSLKEFEVTRYSKSISCMRLKKGDELVGASYADGDSEIVVLTHLGKALRYHEENVSLLGIKASGVKAVSDVKKVGYIIGITVLRKEENTNSIVITDKGGVKVINPKHINLTNRTNKATPIFRCFKSDPHVAIAFYKYEDKEQYNYALLNNLELKQFDVENKIQPFEKNMKKNIDIEDDTKIVLSYNGLIKHVDENTKVYDGKKDLPIKGNKHLNNETQDGEDYEKISIEDLLGDDF